MEEILFHPDHSIENMECFPNHDVCIGKSQTYFYEFKFLNQKEKLNLEILNIY